MLTRRLRILQPLGRQCSNRSISSTGLRSSENNPPERKRRARFITREIRNEEPATTPPEVKPAHDDPPSPGPLPRSLYEALFRKPTPSPIDIPFSTGNDSGNHASPKLTFKFRDYDEEPPRINLRGDDELSGWLNEALVKALRATPKKDEHLEARNPPTVLILSPLPRSLIPSDFYRLAPQGAHVDGWARGLTKVIQARHPYTHEPREQYFLIFDTRSAASAYLENIQALHDQSLEALHPAFYPPSSFSSSRKLAPPSNSYSHSRSHAPEDLAEDLYAADGLENTLQVPDFPSRERLLSYALLPPTTFLTAHMIRVDSLLAQIHRMTLNHPGLVPYAMQRHLTPNHRNPPPPDDNRVLFRLQGGKMTKEHLWDAITADGRERNLEWDLELFGNQDEVAAVAEEAEEEGEGEGEGDARRGPKPKREWNTVRPLKVSQKIVRNPRNNKEEERGEWEPTEEEAEADAEGGVAGYSRYVISFRTATEAKRFVRAWHQRQVGDGRTDRILRVHCTGLW